MTTKKSPAPTPLNYLDAGTWHYTTKRDANRRPDKTVSEPRGGGKKGK